MQERYAKYEYRQYCECLAEERANPDMERLWQFQILMSVEVYHNFIGFEPDKDNEEVGYGMIVSVI